MSASELGLHLRKNPSAREFLFQREMVDPLKRSASFIFVSKNNAVMRNNFFESSFIEKLHVPGADWSRLHSVFLNHETGRLPIGRVENVRTENEELKGDVIFDDDPESDLVFKKVCSGSIRGCSIGYRPLEVEVQEKKDGPDEIIIKRFEIYELSVTGLNADKGAILGRSINHENIIVEEKLKMMEVNTQEIVAKERMRTHEIMTVADKYQEGELGKRFIQEGRGVEELKSLILERISQERPMDTMVGLTDKEIRQFSISRAIKAVLSNDWEKDASFEREVSQAAQKIYNREYKGNFTIPNEVLFRRDLMTNIPGGGQELVPTDYQEHHYIDILRNKMLMTQWCKLVTGLGPNISIPRKTGSGNTQWLAEGEAVNESNMSFDQVTLTPKTVSSAGAYSRLMFMQGNPSVDGLVMADIADNIALELDRAVIHGSGTQGQPKGILLHDITTVDALDGEEGPKQYGWKSIVDFETKIENLNAAVSNMAYLLSPKVKGVLKSRPKIPGHPTFLLDADGTMNGYRVESTRQIPDNTILFGDFSQVLVGLFSGLDILVDPYKKSSSGGVCIFAFQSCDVAIRHSVAFSKNKIPFV
jgi:HK97 family phage major capsid protein/HK97 family phage prohead protease